MHVYLRIVLLPVVAAMVYLDPTGNWTYDAATSEYEPTDAGIFVDHASLVIRWTVDTPVGVPQCVSIAHPATLGFVCNGVAGDVWRFVEPVSVLDCVVITGFQPVRFGVPLITGCRVLRDSVRIDVAGSVLLLVGGLIGVYVMVAGVGVWLSRSL